MLLKLIFGAINSNGFNDCWQYHVPFRYSHGKSRLISVFPAGANSGTINFLRFYLEHNLDNQIREI